MNWRSKQLRNYVESNPTATQIRQFARELHETINPVHIYEPVSKQSAVTWFDKAYPAVLRNIYQPPLVLFYQGDLSLLKTPMIGVVGARQMTSYGETAIRRIIPNLVTANLTIVSGLAEGVDGYAQRITLANRGKTIGVIASSIEKVYPKKHLELQKDVANQGLLLSEYPIGTSPKPFRFVERNRIIAGLGQGLVVIEAKEKSGSLITASLALQGNRNIYAVPGSIFSPSSTGCNQLISAGATPLLNGSEILEDYAYQANLNYAN